MNILSGGQMEDDSKKYVIVARAILMLAIIIGAVILTITFKDSDYLWMLMILWFFLGG